MTDAYLIVALSVTLLVYIKLILWLNKGHTMTDLLKHADEVRSRGSFAHAEDILLLDKARQALLEISSLEETDPDAAAIANVTLDELDEWLDKC